MASALNLFLWPFVVLGGLAVLAECLRWTWSKWQGTRRIPVDATRTAATKGPEEAYSSVQKVINEKSQAAKDLRQRRQKEVMDEQARRYQISQGKKLGGLPSRYIPDEQRRLEESRRLRLEQDAAYEESLAADLQAQQDAAAQASQTAATPEAAGIIADDGKNADNDISPGSPKNADATEQPSHDLGPEPSIEDADASTNTTICDILIRFPEGKRARRRFLSTTTVRVLLDHMENNGFARKGFVLCTAYPRKALSDETQTLADAGISGKVTLHCDPKMFY
eukprot:m.329367 g.329367  ORF g.329367 m.329367 type:complete len:280 (-) comp20446_c0_seq1:149-988(-)